MKKLFMTAALGLAIFASPALSDEDILKFGETTYKQFCSHCHGPKMVNPGTSSFDLRKWPTDRKEQFYTSVLKGKGDMPAWGDVLLPNEIDALWHYVATRAGTEPMPEETAQGIDVLPADTQDVSLVHDKSLTACLARNGGVMSSRRHDGGIGMDYELSRGIAERMGLPLQVTWFESEMEEETTPAKDVIALLSYGLCDIAPGYALYEPILDFYTGSRGAIPRWDDMPDSFRRGTQVDLAAITLSDPYMRMEIGLVARDDVDVGKVQSIRDLDGLKLGVEQGTLPGVLTLRQGTARMNKMAKTFNPGPSFLWEMENGGFDAALVTVGAYDYHLRQNRVSKLHLHPYRHPLGFNLGVAMLAKNTGLIGAVNQAITALAADGTLQGYGEKAGLHYAEPRAPLVQARLNMRDLIATE